MTSVLPEEENGGEAKMKQRQRLLSDCRSRAKEETRPFLSFSRENLSISHSDLEQRFRGSRPTRPGRCAILCAAVTLTVALLCLGLEAWNLRCSAANAREIDHLKRDVESLKHWFLELNTMDVLKAFEEQLHAESAEDDEDDNDDDEADIDDADYDSDYDGEEDGATSPDYSNDYNTPAAGLEVASTASPNPDPEAGLLAALRKVEARHERERERGRSRGDNTTETTLLEEEREALRTDRIAEGRIVEEANNGTERDDVRATAPAAASRGRGKRENVKLKARRSLNDRAILDDRRTTTTTTTGAPNRRHGGRHHSRRTVVTRTYASRESAESGANDDDDDGAGGVNSTAPTVSWDGRPPKKYHAHARPAAEDGQLSEEIARLNRRTSEETTERGAGGEIGWHRSAHRNATGRRSPEIRRFLQVYAIHYGADSSLFSAQDEHTGNGRARHGNGVFKAWRASDWVAELGMNRHFTLAADGRLTVHEPGLYLAYAQIHYLDEHDENGFHLLVNGRPVLQCMVYSPGAGHKSRSCFSAQVTYLQGGDQLVLKDVGSARYTLFQHDKSFFGLAKLGEPRQRAERLQS